MYRTIPLLLTTLLVMFLQTVQGQEIHDTVLSGYVREALYVSPRLKALEARVRMFNQRVPQVSSLPDPRVAFSMNNLPVNSFSFTQEPMTGKMLGLSQMFPFPGKLSTRGDIAGQDERIAQQEFFDTRNDIVRNVRKVYYELAFLQKAIAVDEESRDVLRNISKVVRAKYEVARGTQQDVIKSDFEISRITDRILKLREEYRRKVDEMNSLLLREAGTGMRIDSLTEVGKDQFSVRDLLDEAIQHRPFLQGIKNAADKARAQKELANLEWYPDFMIGAAYSQRDYLAANNNNLVDFLSLSLNLNLPLNNGGKRSAAVEEAEAMINMYTESYNTALQQLQTSFSSSLATLATVHERLELLTTGLLPQASQALNASLAGYQVGDVDYLTVLDNLVKLYQLQTDYHRLRADYWKTRADIDFHTGKAVQP